MGREWGEKMRMGMRMTERTKSWDWEDNLATLQNPTWWRVRFNRELKGRLAFFKFLLGTEFNLFQVGILFVQLERLLRGRERRPGLVLSHLRRQHQAAVQMRVVGA